MLQPRSSPSHVNDFYWKKFISNYEKTVFAQYLVSLGEAHLQKSKKKMSMLSILFRLARKGRALSIC